MANNKVISQLKNKISNGQYETFQLGPELKYVGALPLSGNNNLEEELLLGGNKIITSWTRSSDGTKIKTIEFRSEEDTNEYYIIEEYQYEGTRGASAYVENEILYFDEDLSMTFTYNTDQLEQDVYNKNIKYNPIIEALEFDFLPSDEKVNLKYKDKNNNIINVASKNVLEYDANGIAFRKEIITNYM